MLHDKDNIAKPGAIIFGGYVQGLSYVRNLGKKGVPVAILDNYPPSIASKSKYCKYFSKYPDPVKDEEKFIKFLMSIRKKFKGWLLIPTHDEELVALSKHSSLLKKDFRLTFPGWSIIANIVDKSRFYRKISGIAPIPKTIIPENLSQVEEAKDSLKYPVLVKPSIGYLFYRSTITKGMIAKSPNELVEAYVDVSRIDPQPILQEYIEGPPTNLYSFLSIISPNGKIRLAFTGRKVLQIPTDLGTASVAETIDCPPVKEIGLKVLRRLGFFGLSQVEFKYDPKDNEYKVLEVNGRGIKWIEIASPFESIAWMLYKTFTDTECEESRCDLWKDRIEWIHLADILRHIVRKEIKPTQALSYIFNCKVKTWACASLTDGLPFIIQWIHMFHVFRRKKRLLVAI